MNRSEAPTWTCVACKHWGGRKVGVEHFEGICWKIRKKTVFAAPACEKFEPTTELRKNEEETAIAAQDPVEQIHQALSKIEINAPPMITRKRPDAPRL